MTDTTFSSPPSGSSSCTLASVLALPGVLAALLPLGLVLGCEPELGPCDVEASLRVVYDESGSPAYEGQAQMIASCGGGSFCHSRAAESTERYGAPQGLDYDLRIAEDELQETVDALRLSQALTFEDRHRIWYQVEAGLMPVPGAAGAEVLEASPVYSRFDSVTGEPTPLPGLDTEEGQDLLRNWLACRAPLVERTAPVDDIESVGAVVASRDVTPIEPNWDDIYDRLIVGGRCATGPCHDDSMPAGNLAYPDRMGALTAMVGVAAGGADCAGQGDLIVAGDPDASVLIHKLEGRDASGAPVCGARMPDSGARIDPRSIANIRQWIADGAMP